MNHHHRHGHQQRRPVLNGAGVAALILVLTCWIGGLVLVLWSTTHRKHDLVAVQSPPAEATVIAPAPAEPAIVVETPSQHPTEVASAAPDEPVPAAAAGSGVVTGRLGIAVKEEAPVVVLPDPVEAPPQIAILEKSAGKGRKRAKRSGPAVTPKQSQEVTMAKQISGPVLACEPTQPCTQFIYEDAKGRLRSQFASGWNER